MEAAYERCATNTCRTSDVFYRASTSGGRTWSTPIKASVRTRKWASPADVDIVGKPMVLYTDYNASSSDVVVRQGR